MKNFIYACVGLICLLIYANSYALSHVCSTSYKTINTGDSMEMVKSACGEPSMVSEREEQLQTPASNVQWVYNAAPVVYRNGIPYTIYLPTLTINFQDNKVVEIQKSGFTISGSIYCNISGVVNIGDSIDAVRLACGQPSFINIRQTATTATKKIKIWSYNYGPYTPKLILEFENGILTAIKTGQLGN